MRKITVSHFKRASNHNMSVYTLRAVLTVSHFKRASNHNQRTYHCLCRTLFHISKEHQITTLFCSSACPPHCFTFQKSIKSQQLHLNPPGFSTVSHFKRASNHNKLKLVAALKALFHISKEHICIIAEPTIWIVGAAIVVKEHLMYIIAYLG